MQRNDRRVQTFLDHLYSLDFKERPVSMSRFLDDPNFLGNSTKNGKIIYPVWRDTLTELMAEDSKYLAIFTGAIGTGKTTVAVYGILYVLYRILCLKDCWNYFGLGPGGKLVVVFFNLTKNLGMSTSYQLLQNYLLESPWFLNHGTVRGLTKVYLDIPIFDYRLASPYARGFGTLGGHVIGGIMDEVDSPNESENQKLRVLDAYNNTSRRFTSRFVDPMSGESLGKFFLVASKQKTVSFLNTFIVERKNSPEVYVKSVPIWEAKSTTNYSGKKFHVMIGDAYIPSKILSSSKEIEEAQRSEFQVIEIPVEYRESFIQDINGSLRDLAGVSVTDIRASKLFSSEQIIDDCYDHNKENPVSRSTILMGLKDKIDLTRFIDFTKIRVPKNYPRFLHCDIAFSGDGDALGLGMSVVSGWMRINKQLADGNIEERKVPVVETDFALRLRGRPGDQIDLSAVRRFVLDLRLMGFNIRKFTADHRAMSIDTCQILENAGIQTGYLSLDKTSDGYLLFRDLVRERRWICHKDNYLHFELNNLEYDVKRDKIDHPDKVVKVIFLKDGDAQEVVITGSKDIADGVVGSVVNSLENIEVPPDREVIRNLMNKINDSTFTSIPVTSMKPEIGFLKEKGLGLLKRKEEKNVNEREPSDKVKLLRNIFKKIQDG
ncbi:MAG: hypothetical protein ACTSUP_07935 [Candidatus Heimdallarchaeaceae archaeon]